MSRDMSEIVCTCLNITYGDIKNAIENGATTFEAVVDATDATTVCGLCEDSVREIIDELV